MKYVDTTPNLIYVTDDDALNFIYENYNQIFSKRKDIPIFFSGINNLSMNTILEKKIMLVSMKYKRLNQISISSNSFHHRREISIF